MASDSHTPQFTALSARLADHLASDDLPADAVAPAIRSTLYAAQDAGILPELAEAIETHAGGDAVVAELLDSVRPRSEPAR